MDVQTPSESRISSESPKLPNYTSESKVSQDSTSISSFRPSKGMHTHFLFTKAKETTRIFAKKVPIILILSSPKPNK